MRNMMTTLMAVLFATAIFATNNPVEVGVDLSKSTIEWVGKKVTGKHNGSIALSEANLEMTDGKLTGGSFVVDMNSIVCLDLDGGGKEKLEGHLKSDDFFGVAAHPTASLQLTDVKEMDGKYSATGDLTIKGVTEPITFEIEMADDKAMATIAIDRTKYGIKYGSGSFFDNLGDKAINDEFTLTVTLALAK